jgi:hypothetical protein
METTYEHPRVDHPGDGLRGHNLADIRVEAMMTYILLLLASVIMLVAMMELSE